MRFKIAKIPIFQWTLLLIVVLWSVFPIFLIVSSSLKSPREIFTYPPKIFIFQPQLTNYIELIRNWPKFFYGIKNSIIISSIACIVVLITSSLAAYAFSRFRRKGLKACAFFIIAIRMFPPIVITISLYPLLSRLNLTDQPIILITLYSAFYVSLCTWIMKSFFDEIPVELEEAALIDGCSRLQAFIRITIPLTAPGLVAASVFVVIYSWNEFILAFIFTLSNAQTAPIVINEMLGSMFGVEWGQLFAASTIQLLPPLIFVWLVQSYLIRGMTVGAVKG